MKKILLIISLVSMTIYGYSQETYSNDSLQSKIDNLQYKIKQLEKKEAERSADDQFQRIWKRKKYLSLGYGSQTLEDNLNSEKFKSKFNIGFEMGRMFALHNKPIVNILKIYFDWSYLNLNFAKYKDGSDSNANINLRSADDFDDDDESSDVNIDLGMMQVEYGMSFGPSIHVAPLYYVGGGLEHLKVYTYFHVTPSYSAIIETEDGETQINHGYCTFFNLGAGISYKVISLGYETRWGKSNYNIKSIEEDDDDEGFTDKEKIKFKTATSKIYLRFNF